MAKPMLTMDDLREMFNENDGIYRRMRQAHGIRDEPSVHISSGVSFVDATTGQSIEFTPTDPDQTVVEEIDEAAIIAEATAAMPPSVRAPSLTVCHSGMAPRRAHANDAGLDLPVLADTLIWQGVRTFVSTGVTVAIPPGYYGEIRSRSSAWKRGLDIFCGTIDAGYRGEVKIGVTRSFPGSDTLTAGEYIAQLIIHRCETPVTVTVATPEDLPAPADGRGDAGFGST